MVFVLAPGLLLAQGIDIGDTNVDTHTPGDITPVWRAAGNESAFIPESGSAGSDQ